MICLLELRVGSKEGQLIWKEVTPNSPEVQRCVALQMGKENLEALGPSVKAKTEEIVEIEKLSQEGLLVLQINSRGRKILVNIRLTELDRKAADAITGLTGSFCDLCFLSKTECHCKDNIVLMTLERTHQSTIDIAEMLADDEGNVIVKPGDYATRKGVKRAPSTAKEVESLQVLHLILRILDWARKLIYHEAARASLWSDSKFNDEVPFVKAEKQRIQDHIRQETGMMVDCPDNTGKGGTTTTGGMSQRLFYDPVIREVMLALVDEDKKPDLRRLCQGVAVSLRIVNCTEYVTKLNEFREYTKSLYEFILDTWPQPKCNVSKSVHKLLGHGADLIQKNDGYGLGALGEHGLEACQKTLRFNRTHLSRKTSQLANLEDCQKRIFVTSDPSTIDKRNSVKPYCTLCKVRGHSVRYCTVNLNKAGCKSEDDALVDYFIHGE